MMGEETLNEFTARVKGYIEKSCGFEIKTPGIIVEGYYSG
jgi:hypothetical protein